MSFRNERGEGAIKTIIIVAVVLYGVFVGIKMVATKADDKTLEDKTKEMAKYAGVNREDANALNYKIMKLANEKNLPLTKENLLVEEQPASWHIKYSYDNSQKLVFWTWQNKINFDETIPKG